jgi:hypothetical protein
MHMQPKPVEDALGSSYKDAVQTKTLLLCGMIAGPLFTLAWLVEGATRANYHPLRHPVSSLALGDLGWTQIANFIVAGLLTLAFAVGLWRALRPRGGSTWGPLLIGAYAIGLLGAGIFVTDPVSGYPPGTPDQLIEYSSVHAALHDLFSIPTFVGLPIACFVFARRFVGWGQRGWAIYSTVSGLAFAVMFLLASAGFAQAAGQVDLAGLFQRITITIGWSWLTLLAIRLLNARSETLGTVGVEHTATERKPIL